MAEHYTVPNLKGMGSGRKRPHRNTCAAPNLAKRGAQGGNGRRRGLPRVSSPNGIAARAATRLAVYEKVRDDTGFQKPGSLNPRKVGR